MNRMYLSLKKTTFMLLVFTLILSAIGAAGVQAEESASTDDAIVYYVSNGNLYRVKTDGSPSQMIRKNFEGVELKPAGDYLYYFYDNKSTTLLRLSLNESDSKAQISNFGGDKRILHYVTDGDMIYFMDDKGGIYRASANEKAIDGVLVTDMADINNPRFIVESGRIYYNALKSGRTTWVASKAANGSGQVQWIASGAFQDPYYARTDSTTLYLMINTKPSETNYSIDCMVLYTLPKKGGAAKAVNPKAPLDTNAVYSGSWANEYYLYNNGIRLGSDQDYDYTKGQGYVLHKNGTKIQLSKTGIYEIANVGTNKLAYVDAYGKAYVSTIQNNKVTATKTLAIKNAGYVRNLMTDGKVRTTMLFGESGAYILNADLSLKKMIGVEWDLCQYQDDITGVFYINAGDNGRLYRMYEDGKTTVKLSDEKVSRIVLISKP
ncbi:DUF5050 domain-containing protein [Cohnella terricola]|uniref:DUF5050 domain-containing protein n=1 Tax=Cohnella terricola TaxID=1289167 RepID=A0A559JJ42_9BACL|nr:DUF5050 domain-containing protein [Cohnella terricola]TVX99876.1 DUF5050 domain-containing protein [Cohnella terricola]